MSKNLGLNSIQGHLLFRSNLGKSRDELLIVDLSGHGDLQIGKGFLGSLHGNFRVIKLREDLIVAVLGTTSLLNFKHVSDEIEHCFNELGEFIEAHRARIVLVEEDEGRIDLL